MEQPNQNSEFQQKIQDIINKIEDEFIFESKYKEGVEFMNSIIDPEIKQTKIIQSLEARIVIYDDPFRSEKLMSELFEKDPFFFRNTFEYLTLLFDSYEGKAIEVQQKVLELLNNYKPENKDDDDGYYLACLSIAKKTKKNVKQIRTMMKDSIKQFKKNYQKSDMYSQLGNTHLELNEYEAAIKYYIEGLKLQPKNDECLNNISYCYLEMHELDKSVQYGLLALKNYPYNSTVLCNLAIVYEEQNEIELAEQAYQNLFKNKSIGAVQHANYSQFLFENKQHDQNKRVEILENLKKGFLYDSTKQNSIFQTFGIMVREADTFTKLMYSFKTIIEYINFIETIRMKEAHLLSRIQQKIVQVLTVLQKQQIDDEFEDVDEEEEEEEDDEEEEENEDETNQDSINMQIEEKPQMIEIQQTNDKVEHIPYNDDSLKKDVTLQQKIMFYTFIDDLIKLKFKENQMIFKLIAYNKFIKDELHFQSNIQFWDLYFD